MKIMRYTVRNLIPDLALTALALYGLNEHYYAINSPSNPFYSPMKSTSYITICCIAFAAMLIFTACGVNQFRPTVDYPILIDETDSTFAVPDTAEVISDIGLDTNMWMGVNFSLSRIQDVSYTPHAFLSLAKGGNRLASNQYARKREVEAFKTKLAALLNSLRHDIPGKPRSSVYLAIVQELSRLANSKADRKVLTIFSDMRENTQTVSFYDPHTALLLANDPESIEAKLFAESKLPDMSGIEIRIVYSPKNAKDDATFRAASNFFKQLFEAAGAEKVTISANLIQQ